jgi:N-methylhydantoinase A
MRIAIDTGGTFTDCVYLENGTLAVLKVLSTPNDPARSVLEAIRQVAAAEHVEVRHGTTIGTNALLERKGARVAFVTTAGFEDTIAIGRQARQHLYDWLATPAACIVPPELRFGVPERVSAEGEILVSPTEEELDKLREQIRVSGAESIAISLLFSFANPENERRVAAALRQERIGLCGSDVPVRQNDRLQSETLNDIRMSERSDKNVRPTQPQVRLPDIPISVSHEILPEFREYERAATVVVNAYLAPRVGGYLQRLESAIQSEHGGSLYVMQSSGGIISGKLAANEPVRTVLSGPAGGVIGAHRVAKLSGFENIIGFDMGGTSTDVSLIDSAGPRTTSEARISDIPISVPMLDIHTVGAGGGSLAWFDRGGILHVGPASAGADPGPICYGRGEQPTVTDANLTLGRLDAELSLAGTVHLDERRTRQFMEQARGPIPSLEEFAAGIVRVAEAEMEKAIRLISVERGHDPREFTLVCFGGAGPLHACSLARALGIPRVLVPAMPGALSALGILISEVVRDYSRTVMIPFAAGEQIHDELDPYFAELEAKGAAEFREQRLSGVANRSVDLRYLGQGYELNVAAGPQMLADFHAAHRKRYGHADESRSVEVVNVRLRMVAASDAIALPRKPVAGSTSTDAILKQKRVMFNGEWLDAPVFQHDLLSPGNRFEGPAIVHEYSATTVVPPGCRAELDEYSNMVIEV